MEAETTKGVLVFYAYSRSLLPCVMAMTERGLRVDDALRQERLAALTKEAVAIQAAVQPIVEPLQERLQERKLLWKRRVCKSCRNGSKKRLTCTACSGLGSATTFTLKLGSPRQLADICFNGLKLPRRSRKGKTTVDEEALKSLLPYDKSGFVAQALRFAKLSTMREIYERVGPGSDGLVRTVFNVAGTYTGRFSSSEAFYWPHSTNLQNLPAQEARREQLFAVREVFGPRSGCMYIYADLSQAEARVVAYLSEDAELIANWERDPWWDIHRHTAAQMFGIALSQVTPMERHVGKASHKINYGIGAKTLARDINDVADLTGRAVTIAECKQFIARIHKARPCLDQWWGRVQQHLEAKLPMVASHCGWECDFWPRFSYDGSLDPESLRAAIAWEPQHTVVHVLNEGMRMVYEQEKEAGWRLLFQGHDSILVEVPQERAPAAATRLKALLERPTIVNGHTLTIPVEVFVGERNWGELQRIL